MGNQQVNRYVDNSFTPPNVTHRIAEIPSSLSLVHRPENPAYLCIADDRLVIRVMTLPGKVVSVRLATDRGEWEMDRQLVWPLGEIWRISLPIFPSLRYRFIATTLNGSTLLLPENTQEMFFFDGTKKFPQVKWIENGIIYQIFPERFCNGNPKNDVLALKTDEALYNKLWKGEKPFISKWNELITSLHCCHQYFGGDLAGIIENIDYLSRLGVTVLYLNPIFDSGSAHGYDTYDYMKISPKFGNESDLKRLLNEAHKRGICIILDFVPNHTGLGFWAFQDVIKKGQKSPYWNWYFIRKWPFQPGDASAYECWWGVPSLPKLNTGNPEVKKYLFDVARYWIKFGIDGWRIDAPNEVIDAHNFFREMRKVVKKENPNSYLVGEIWQLDPSWIQGDEFDSLMNYALGRDILLNYARGSANGDLTLSLLSHYFAVYGENIYSMGFNIVDSHDTSRVLTELGGGKFGDTPREEGIKRLKFLSTLLYTMPGAPVIFQGDERGILGEKEFYDAQRYPIQWDKINVELLSHYIKLAHLRKEIPALTSSVIRVYISKGNIISFFRGERGEGEVLIIANNGNQSSNIELPSGIWKIIGEEKTLEGVISVPPIEVLILQQVS
jgi:glycosidase